MFQPYQIPASATPNSRSQVNDVDQLVLGRGGVCLSRGVSAAERIAEDVETEMMLSKRLQFGSDNVEDDEIKSKIAYSCVSLTSPVMAEKPMNGFAGREISFKVKQSLHSSPVIIKNKIRIKNSWNTHSLSTGPSPI